MCLVGLAQQIRSVEANLPDIEAALIFDWGALELGSIAG